MKRKLSAAIALLLALSSVACGSENEDVSTENTGNETSAAETESDPRDIPDELPETDLDGYKFRILGFGEETLLPIFVEEQNGSLVNDAVYKKIRTVEDRFNCEITSLFSGAEDDMKSMVMSDEDSFDMASGHDIHIANLTLEGLFMNVREIPYIDLDKPWWPKYTVESLTFDDQMYMFSNHMSYKNISDTRVMYFNKKLLEDNQIDAPYQLVYDNEWTLDKLNSITATGYVDLNGSTTIDAEDQFGIVNPPDFYCIFEPYHIEVYQDDGKGTLTYNFNLEKCQTIVDKLHKLLLGDGGFIGKDRPETYKIFTDGDSMFVYAALNVAVSNFSQTNVSYGILPLPKLEQNNDPYYAGTTDRPCVVPITAAQHIDKTGLILEALSAEGYKQVYPAYFEQALKARYADQNDDAKMLDIINENVILSFSFVYGNYKSPNNMMLETLFKKGKESTDVASYAASIEAFHKARCEEITEKFNDMKTK